MVAFNLYIQDYWKTEFHRWRQNFTTGICLLSKYLLWFMLRQEVLCYGMTFLLDRCTHCFCMLVFQQFLSLSLFYYVYNVKICIYNMILSNYVLSFQDLRKDKVLRYNLSLECLIFLKPLTLSSKCIVFIDTTVFNIHFIYHFKYMQYK